ncbi:MAG: 50S ribosomal protein L24 [candidate division WS6 bacterium GW2011_WS6_36_26]|nr:MAG: 50S ribosomal protein L24 [candidate division WS6 bacterium GW2011_WS6_36_26]
MIRLFLLLQKYCNLRNKKMKIKKGDTVKILYGKDSGKTGPVVAVDLKNNMVVVSGVNVSKRHLKGDGRTRTSEILTIEKPMAVSKVILVCPLCGKTTRVGLKREDGKVTRICKKCGKEIADKKEEKVEVKKETEVKKTVKKTTKSKTNTK